MGMQIFLWAALLIPWIAMFIFLDKDVIKRYMPVAIFVSLLVTIIFEMAHALKWWVLLEDIVPWGYITNVSFAYGIFLIGTILIFRFTYQKFWLYIITNVAIDAFFAFVLNDFFVGRIYRLVNFTELQVFLLMVALAVVIYGYQVWQESISKNPNSNKVSPEIEIRNSFRTKDKAR